MRRDDDVRELSARLALRQNRQRGRHRIESRHLIVLTRMVDRRRRLSCFANRIVELIELVFAP
jgi:hypothetical protein